MMTVEAWAREYVLPVIGLLTPGRWINLVSAALGAIGAIVLFNGSFAYESFSPMHSRSQRTDTVKAQTERNRRRQSMQRIGLGLILASFVLQGVAQFFD
jgi:hypothetical protein